MPARCRCREVLRTAVRVYRRAVTMLIHPTCTYPYIAQVTALKYQCFCFSCSSSYRTNVWHRTGVSNLFWQRAITVNVVCFKGRKCKDHTELHPYFINYSVIFMTCVYTYKLYIQLYICILYNKVAQLVEALRYKPEGRGFNSWLGHWDFSLT
jgi:hypothetical protein